MTRKANTNDSRKRKASQQQDGSQGVGVLSSISLNKKVHAPIPPAEQVRTHAWHAAQHGSAAP